MKTLHLMSMKIEGRCFLPFVLFDQVIVARATVSDRKCFFLGSATFWSLMLVHEMGNFQV